MSGGVAVVKQPKHRNGGRPPKPDAVRRQPWWARRAAARAAEFCPPTRELLLRRLEAAVGASLGIDDKSFCLVDRGPMTDTAAEIIKEISALNANQLDKGFPLDILLYEHEQDERAKVRAGRRRGIDSDQWGAGWKLASLRYALYGVPSVEGYKAISRFIPDEKDKDRQRRLLDKIADRMSNGRDVEEAAQEFIEERMRKYKDALATLSREGRPVLNAVVRTAIYWEMPANHTQLSALRIGLAAMVRFFEE